MERFDGPANILYKMKKAKIRADRRKNTMAKAFHKGKISGPMTIPIDRFKNSTAELWRD